MKKVYYLAVAGIVGFMITAVTGNSAPPEKIEIKHVKKVMPPVVFPHKKHFEELKFECTTCHHKWEKKEGTEPKGCNACHKSKKEGNKPSLKNAYHKRCKDCHKKKEKEGKNPPTNNCKGCHKK